MAPRKEKSEKTNADQGRYNPNSIDCVDDDADVVRSAGSAMIVDYLSASKSNMSESHDTDRL